MLKFRYWKTWDITIENQLRQYGSDNQVHGGNNQPDLEGRESTGNDFPTGLGQIGNGNDGYRNNFV